MEKGYFSAAWSDITKSPGWFSKTLRLGLLNLIPIFGVLVTYGYLYGWARDIAWNVHRPMPDRIFGNEDGNLFKRGFFILVIGFVFSLIPGVFNTLTSVLTGFSIFGFVYSDASFGAGALFMGLIFSLVGLALTFAVVFFYWVGSMRCALYGTLSSGFQFGKIWAMMRYDFTGLLRIFGMSLICGCVVGIGFFVIFMLSVILGTIFGVAFIRNESQAVVFVLIILLLVLLLCVVTVFISVFVAALIIRALGYWTRQFQVNLWGGQEDPLPFELEQARQAQQQYGVYQAQQPFQQAQPYQQAPYQQGQSYQQQPYQQAQSYQSGQPFQQAQSYQQQPYQQAQSGQQQFNQQTQFVQGQPIQQTQPYQPKQPFQAAQQQEQFSQTQQPQPGQPVQPPVIDVDPMETSSVTIEKVAAPEGNAQENAASNDVPTSEENVVSESNSQAVGESDPESASQPTEESNPEAESQPENGSDLESGSQPEDKSEPNSNSQALSDDKTKDEDETGTKAVNETETKIKRDSQ